MSKLITIILLPYIWLHLIIRFFGKSKNLCEQDQSFNLRHRGNPFSNKVMQFAYYLVWLPEYRSVFYRRAGVLGKVMNIYLPGQKCLYIRTSKMGGGDMY